jgi:hypothetical protein
MLLLPNDDGCQAIIAAGGASFEAPYWTGHSRPNEPPGRSSTREDRSDSFARQVASNQQSPTMSPDAVRKLIRRAFHDSIAPPKRRSTSPPERCLHFTDLGGLLGILGDQLHFRLNRARSSNDRMEIEYGLGIARRLLDDRAHQLPLRPGSLRMLETALEPFPEPVEKLR